MTHAPTKNEPAFPGAETLNLRLLGFMTEDETALTLGVTKATLRNWRARKRGPPVSFVGRKPVYSFDGLREHVESQTVIQS